MFGIENQMELLQAVLCEKMIVANLITNLLSVSPIPEPFIATGRIPKTINPVATGFCLSLRLTKRSFLSCISGFL